MRGGDSVPAFDGHLGPTFLAHWRGLRGDLPAPSLRSFLDHPEPSCAPYVYILDVKKRELRVRLMGTLLEEVRKRNITGDDYLKFQKPVVRDAIFQNMKGVVSSCCGLRSGYQTKSNRDRDLSCEVLVLPLADDNGFIRYTAGVTEVMTDLLAGEVQVAWTQVTGIEWIDLGSGTPAVKPASPEPDHSRWSWNSDDVRLSVNHELGYFVVVVGGEVGPNIPRLTYERLGRELERGETLNEVLIFNGDVDLSLLDHTQLFAAADTLKSACTANDVTVNKIAGFIHGNINDPVFKLWSVICKERGIAAESNAFTELEDLAEWIGVDVADLKRDVSSAKPVV